MTKCDFARVKLASLSVQAKRKKSETSLLDRVLRCLPGDLASFGQGAPVVMPAHAWALTVSPDPLRGHGRLPVC